MPTMTIPTDMFVAGSFAAQSISLPAGTVLNAGIGAGADVDASKLEHQHQPCFAQNHGTAATAQRQVIHVVRGTTGTIIAFECGVSVACIGDSTITINLKKNGSNILSAATVLNNSNTAFTNEDAAGFTSTALVQGDCLEIDVTVSAGTGTLGQGLFAQLTVREDAA